MRRLELAFGVPLLVLALFVGHEAWGTQVRAKQMSRAASFGATRLAADPVARGEVELYVNNYTAMHDWDVCAGDILVTEAGGKVTGLLGQQLHYGSEGAWQRFGLLATNSLLHEAAVKQLSVPAE